MLGKTNVRKWKIFQKRIIQEPYQTTEEYIDHYDTKAVAVGSASAAMVQTNINQMTLQGTGGGYQSGDWYTGSAVVETSETRPYQGTVYSRQTVGLGWSCGRERNPRVISASVTLMRNQRVPVYGTRTVTKYRDKEVIEEVWHPWWVRNKG